MSEEENLHFFDNLTADSNTSLAVEEDDLNVSLDSDEMVPKPTIKNEDGRLEFKLSNVLVKLLKEIVIHSEKDEESYKTIVNNKEVFEKQLANLHLSLTIDYRSGIVFVSEMTESDFENEEDFKNKNSLVYKNTLTQYETIVLLVLRRFYQEREKSGDIKAIIDVDQIFTRLTPFLGVFESENTARKKLNGALKELRAYKILLTARGQKDRFEISPVIRSIVNADFLEQMLTRYQELAITNGGEVIDDNSDI